MDAPPPTVHTYPRGGILAAASFIVGLFFGCALPDLNLGYPALNTSLAGLSLVVCSIICLFLLFRNHGKLAVSYWAGGLALIISVLPTYYSIKTEAGLCHLTTAKWTTVLIGTSGVCLLFYGFIRWVEAERKSSEAAPAGQASWSAQEIKSFVLAFMLFVSLYVLEVRLIVNCWW